MRFNLLLPLFLGVGLSGATLTIGDRSTITYIYNAGGDFSTAIVNYYNLTEVRGNSGDTAIHPWSARTLGQNHFVNDGTNTSTSIDLTGLPGIMTANVELTAGTNGYYDWGYDTPVGADFSQSFITSGLEAGRYALYFSGGGSGGTGFGDTFVSTIYILGDWSNPANRSALSHNAGWTITENFFYNGVDRTIISGYTEDYDGTNPGFAFTLYGDRVPGTPVPEPSTGLLAAAGVLWTAAQIRKSKSN